MTPIKINVTPRHTKDQERAYKLQCFLNELCQSGERLVGCPPHPLTKAGRAVAEMMEDMTITETVKWGGEICKICKHGYLMGRPICAYLDW